MLTEKLGRFGLVFRLGWTATLAVVIPLVLGLWLDRQLATSPRFVFAGALAGIIIATILVVRVAIRAIENLAAPNQKPTGRVARKEDGQ